MGSEFKSKYTGTEIDNILDNALNGGVVLDISEYFESLLNLDETNFNNNNDILNNTTLENPLLIELLKKINEIKPTILTATDSLGNKFSTSAIKWSETSGNGIVYFITKFKIFNPLVGFLSFTLFDINNEYGYLFEYQKVRFY